MLLNLKAGTQKDEADLGKVEVEVAQGAGDQDTV